MRDVLGWNRSGYYAWHQNREARQEKADAEEDPARRIRAIHTDSRGAYGACRIAQKLRSQGHAVNRERVARIMRERDIVGIARRKPRSLTRRDRTAPPTPDLVQREFTAPMPGLVAIREAAEYLGRPPVLRRARAAAGRTTKAETSVVRA